MQMIRIQMIRTILLESSPNVPHFSSSYCQHRTEMAIASSRCMADISWHPGIQFKTCTRLKSGVFVLPFYFHLELLTELQIANHFVYHGSQRKRLISETDFWNYSTCLYLTFNSFLLVNHFANPTPALRATIPTKVKSKVNHRLGETETRLAVVLKMSTVDCLVLS